LTADAKVSELITRCYISKSKSRGLSDPQKVLLDDAEEKIANKQKLTIAQMKAMVIAYKLQLPDYTEKQLKEIKKRMGTKLATIQPVFVEVCNEVNNNWPWDQMRKKKDDGSTALMPLDELNIRNKEIEKDEVDIISLDEDDDDDSEDVIDLEDWEELQESARVDKERGWELLDSTIEHGNETHEGIVEDIYSATDEKDCEQRVSDMGDENSD
jgi:hypothetical protein